jgi:hypothetical protein
LSQCKSSKFIHNWNGRGDVLVIKKKNKKRKMNPDMEEFVEGTADASDSDNGTTRKDPPEPQPEPEPAINGVLVEEGSPDDIMDEGCDMGDSDEDGEEVDIHNQAAILREVFESSNEPIGDDADNLDDVKGEEFAHNQLLGAPDGWVPPGPPPNWTG